MTKEFACIVLRVHSMDKRHIKSARDEVRKWELRHRKTRLDSDMETRDFLQMYFTGYSGEGNITDDRLVCVPLEMEELMMKKINKFENEIWDLNPR